MYRRGQKKEAEMGIGMEDGIEWRTKGWVERRGQNRRKEGGRKRGEGRDYRKM